MSRKKFEEKSKSDNLLAFANNLRRLRKERKLSQEKVNSDLDFNVGDLTRWEKGYAYPHIETLIKLANYYEVSLDSLFGREYSIPVINKLEEMHNNNVSNILYNLAFILEHDRREHFGKYLSDFINQIAHDLEDEEKNKKIGLQERIKNFKGFF